MHIRNVLTVLAILTPRYGDAEEGFSTAELLANAALAIAALAAIWLAMRQLGLDIVDWMRTQLIG